MNFTLLSPIFIILLAFGVCRGILKGRSDGFFKASVNLGIVLLSVILSSLISSYLIAPKLSIYAITLLDEYINLSEYISGNYDFEEIVEAVLSMVLSSLIFLIVFTVIYIILSITAFILFKTVLRPHASDLGYASGKAPWYVRNNKGLGTAIGGISAFILVMVMLSPIVGTLKTADTVITVIDDVKAELDRDKTASVSSPDSSDMVITEAELAVSDKFVETTTPITTITPVTSIVGEDGKDYVIIDGVEYEFVGDMTVETAEPDEDVLDIITRYSNDFMSTVIYYGGAKMFYDMGARARIDGKTVVLSEEIDLMGDLAIKVVRHGPALGKLESFDSSDLSNLVEICDGIEDSHLLSVAAAEFVSSIAGSWLRDEALFGIERPSIDSMVDPLLDVVLQALAATDSRTVGEDLKTVVRVCSVIAESGIVSTGGDYDALMASFEDGTLIDRITMVLESNPKMAAVVDNLYLLVMKTVVKTIKFDGYDIAEYDGLIEELTEQFNRLNGQKYEKKVETLTGYAMEYIGDYGIDVPEGVAEMVVGAMISSIPTTDGYITSDQMQEFFNRYYSGN